MRKDQTGNDCLINAFYICILDMLRTSVVTTDDYKYRTIEDFLQAPDYSIFAQLPLPSKEKQLLWLTANWMCIFYRMVSSKGNMGLAKNVVSKLLEGWEGGCLRMFACVKIYLHCVCITHVCMYAIVFICFSDVPSWRRTDTSYSVQNIYCTRRRKRS